MRKEREVKDMKVPPQGILHADCRRKRIWEKKKKEGKGRRKGKGIRANVPLRQLQ